MNSDIFILGAGPSGICSAISSARMGLSVIIADRYAMPGGTLTNCWVNPMMTFHNENGDKVINGIAQEIVDNLVKNGFSPGHLRDTIGFAYSFTPYDNEGLKKVILEMICREKIKLLLNTYFIKVKKKSRSEIGSVILCNKSGMTEVSSGVFIDCSGDGDLAFKSGLNFEIGNEQGRTQPFTLIFKLSDIDINEVIKSARKNKNNFYKKTKFDLLDKQPQIAISGFFSEMSVAEISVKRDRVLFFTANNNNEVYVNMTRLAYYDPLNEEDIVRATKEGIEQVYEICRFLKKNISGFARSVLSGIAPSIGIRDSRRFLGEYVIDENDIINGRDFNDSIARGAFPIDIHSSTDDRLDAFNIKKDYGIPYRCLYNKKISNLLFSGRCISATFKANGSTRLSPTCMALGQAAGTAASLMYKKSLSCGSVNISELRKILSEQSQIL